MRATRRQVCAYAMGGGGDIGIVAAYLLGQLRAHPDAGCVGVGAGYSWAHYLHTLEKTNTTELRDRRTGEVKGVDPDGRRELEGGRAEAWLRYLFGCEGGQPEAGLCLQLRNEEFETLQGRLAELWGRDGVAGRSVGWKYGTGLDELLVRHSVFRDEPAAGFPEVPLALYPDFFLLYTVAEGARYKGFDGQAVSQGAMFDEEQSLLDRELGLSRESVHELVTRHLPGCFGGDAGEVEHVLFDVGGDMVDFQNRGRDANLLRTLVSYFASREQLCPRIKIYILGPGVDGHMLPELMEARLLRLGFVDASADPQNDIQPLLRVLRDKVKPLSELTLLAADASSGHSRATQLFLDAIDGNSTPFTYPADPRQVSNTIFGRVESSSKSPEERENWRSRLELDLPNQLAIMRKVYLLDIGSAARAREVDALFR